MNKAKMLKKYGLTFDNLPFTIFTDRQSPCAVNLQAKTVSLFLWRAKIKKLLSVFCPFAGQNALFCVFHLYGRHLEGTVMLWG